MSAKYNDDMGKVYDTAFYITAYFREEDFFSLLRGRLGKTNDVTEAMHGFYDFKERHKSLVLPSEIIPFVYTDYSSGLCSFLINVIRGNLSFQDHTKDGVISFLQNREMIRRSFWEHFFPQKKDRIAERLTANDPTLNVSDTISQLDMPENVKLHFVSMAYDFPKYQRKLVAIFREIYPLVVNYHSENQSVIDEIKMKITDELSDRFRNIFKLPETVLAFPFSYSLLNGLLIDYRVTDKKVCFVLGSHFNDVIEALLRYDHISFHSFGKIVYVKTRSDMVDLFLDYKRLCASEIAHKLQISRSTIYLHLNAMHFEGVIKHSYPDKKNNGEKVYFSINPEYFKVYAGLSADVNQRAYNNVSKGIEKYDLPRKKRKAKDGLIYNNNDEYDEENLE